MKNVFTTGDVAKLLGTTQRTVGKYCDAGELKCFRLPSIGPKGQPGDRRITRAALDAFCRAHELTINADGTALTL